MMIQPRDVLIMTSYMKSFWGIGSLMTSSIVTSSIYDVTDNPEGVIGGSSES